MASSIIKKGITEIQPATLVNPGYSKTVNVQQGDIYLVIGGDNTSTAEFAIVTCKKNIAYVQVISNNGFINVTGNSDNTFTVTVSDYSQALAITKL